MDTISVHIFSGNFPIFTQIYLKDNVWMILKDKRLFFVTESIFMFESGTEFLATVTKSSNGNFCLHKMKKTFLDKQGGEYSYLNCGST